MTDSDKITIDRETAEQAANALLDLPLRTDREVIAEALRAALAAPAADEMSPEFTDTARNALLWVLWHHQGASSKVGQAMRFALGMGAHDRLTERQIADAKRWSGPVPGLARALAQPAEPLDSIHAELWRLAVRKGVVTVESKLIDDRNPNTRCSWMQGNDKACDISNDAAKVAGDRP